MKRARFCLMLAISLVIVLGFGSTALATCDPPYEGVGVEAQGTYECTTDYTWGITKSVEPDSLTLKPGQGGTVTYKIDVTKEGTTTTTSNPKGILSFKVKGGRRIIATITAWVENGNGDKVTDVVTRKDNEVYDRWGHGDETYHVDYTPSLNLSPDEVEQNNYKIVFNMEIQWQQWVGGFGGHWETYNTTTETPSAGFSDTCADNDEPITVQDIMGASDLPPDISYNYHSQTFPVTEAGPITYPVTFTNNGNQTVNSYTFKNIASIVGMEVPPSEATVTIHVAAPDPTPKQSRKPRDRSTPTPEPTAEAVAVELPKTGGLIEWEWIALAGGLLTSGGGLYLLRRRRMKK